MNAAPREAAGRWWALALAAAALLALAWAWLALTLLATPLAAQPAAVVRGEVRAEGTGEPLRGVSLEAFPEAAPAARAATLSDSLGQYRLRLAQAGRLRLRAYHPAYLPLEVEALVPPGGEVVLELALRVRPVALRPVIARARPLPWRADTVPLPAAELAVAGLRALEGMPGALAEVGLTDALRGLPGQEPVDPADVLYVRGSAAELKLVLLDGAPIYAPFHFGGLIDSFEPQALGAAALYLGGAPARYDGGLSYVLDLRTRGGQPGGFQSRGSVDLLASRALVEGPVGSRVRYLAAGRAVHGLGTRAWADGGLPYGYADALLRTDADLGGDWALALTGFRNRERFRFGDLALPDSNAHWQNAAASLRLRGPLPLGELELTAALSDYDSRLPLGGTRGWRADGGASRARLHAELVRDEGPLRVGYGLSVEQTTLRSTVFERASAEPVLRARAAGHTLGAYVDAAWRPSPVLRLRGGLRADHYSLQPGLRLAPRLSATWRAGERIALTLAAGRYHQQVRAPDSVWAASVVSGSRGRALGEPLAVAGATHLSAGLDQELAGGVRMGVEGFYKHFSGVPAERGSDAAASGMDLWVRRGSGRVTGWVGYSLAWVWSLPEVGTTSERFSGRQLLSAGVGTPLGRSGRFDAGFAYGAGLPYTAIPLSMGPANDGIRTESGSLTGAGETPPLSNPASAPYLRLNLSVARTFAPRWAGRPHELTPYLRVLNALDRRDALFYRYRADEDAFPRPIGALPLLPVLGVEWRW